jgi:hypothetical protein
VVADLALPDQVVEGADRNSEAVSSLAHSEHHNNPDTR